VLHTSDATGGGRPSTSHTEGGTTVRGPPGRDTPHTLVRDRKPPPHGLEQGDQAEEAHAGRAGVGDMLALPVRVREGGAVGLLPVDGERDRVDDGPEGRLTGRLPVALKLGVRVAVEGAPLVLLAALGGAPVGDADVEVVLVPPVPLPPGGDGDRRDSELAAGVGVAVWVPLALGVAAAAVSVGTPPPPALADGDRVGDPEPPAPKPLLMSLPTGEAVGEGEEGTGDGVGVTAPGDPGSGEKDTVGEGLVGSPGPLPLALALAVAIVDPLSPGPEQAPAEQDA
jgi:hypothetical protein